MRRRSPPRALGRAILAAGLAVALPLAGLGAAAPAAGGGTKRPGVAPTLGAAPPASEAGPPPLQDAASRPPVAAGRAPAGSPADPAAVQAGRKLFLRHCAECHGEDARGGRRAPPLDTERVRQATAEDLFWFVTNGNLRTGMPSWSRLPSARRWQILAYLRSLPAPPGPPAAAAGGDR
jgi:mono/diheme cytochrome c family protein